MKYSLIGTDCPDGISQERYKDIMDFIATTEGYMSLHKQPTFKDSRVYDVFVRINLPETRQVNRHERTLGDMLLTLFEVDHAK